jgi:hypothetical protein
MAGCAPPTPPPRADAIKTDVHAPAKARVNLTLSNFDKFAEAVSLHGEGQDGGEKRLCALVRLTT